MRIVNHIDGIKTITTKTGILNSLRIYYNKLRDKKNIGDNIPFSHAKQESKYETEALCLPEHAISHHRESSAATLRTTLSKITMPDSKQASEQQIVNVGNQLRPNLIAIAKPEKVK